MTPHQFVAKWAAADLSERAAYVSHFNDLCDLVGYSRPTDVDPKGTWYTFERGVETTDGKKGWADVWHDGKFGWEYKGRHKDLKAAYQQLLKYREALNNPPLLVVCDLDRFEIHTNFPGTAKKVYAFDLEGLKDARNVQVLRHVFTKPDELRPDRTQAAVTREIAEKFARLADGMRKRGVPADRAAHFLMKLMFCMFAEDIDLLPRGLFTKTVKTCLRDPARLARQMKKLFEAMHAGDDFGTEGIEHFNGGLFADSDVLDLTEPEVAELLAAAECDWSNVEPSIFGTLFERTLDPETRAPLGAHYTSREDIETLLKPVFEAPLRREWTAVRARAEVLFEKVRKQAAAQAKPTRKASKARQEFDQGLEAFAHRLTQVKVLDPACGSGNFLYVALHLLLDLEKEVRTYAADRDTTLPQAVRPTQLLGLEKNEYAQQLAQEVIWIGFLQWIENNGEQYNRRPVLDPLDTIRRTDAILDLSDPANPKEPDWPAAEFIVGNPPFLGGKMLRSNLGDEYVNAMFRVWSDRVRPEADLVVYWFEKARAMIEAGRVKRAGLLATQGIRGGANRATLARIKETGDIFFAVSDRDWVLDGANVHISMVGFDDGTEARKELDGKSALTINANLSANTDLTRAKLLPDTQGISFMGDTKGGAFDIPFELAWKLLQTPNVNGRPSSDVITPWCNGKDVTQRSRDSWIIDYGIPCDESTASKYEGVFEYIRSKVYPDRQGNSREAYRLKWWLHAEARAGMRKAFRDLPRFAAMPRVAKHLVFVWFQEPTLPDCQLIAFAGSDDHFLGILHSHAHETWAKAQGTQVRERESGFRYTPTTCFETFPFPDLTAQREAIRAAAKELDDLRTRWLNPPEWTRTETLEFPGSTDGPWRRYVHDPDARGIGTVRYPRIVPKDADSAAKLKKRTLTNLYNERPAWLAAAHKRLDEAVAAAYSWPADLPDDEILARLLALNLERA
jgi:type II restriction/modification system DNA methylase subunit YeeA